MSAGARSGVWLDRKNWGEFAGQSWLKSSGRELVEWRVSVNALDGLNAKFIVIHPLPPLCSYSARPWFFAVSILVQICDHTNKELSWDTVDPQHIP